MNNILCLILFFITTSCANYTLKKNCESTNWFDYAQKIAYSGKYLEEDDLVKNCKSVDVINSQQLDVGFKLGREKMCSYDEMLKRGQQGEVVYFQFCDGLSIDLMKAKYEQGLKFFCTQPSGLTYGRSGQVYKKVCAFQPEIEFMKGYRPGRSEFLTIQIKNSQRQIENLNSEIPDLIRQESSLNNNLSYLPRGETCMDQKVYDELQKKEIIRTVCKTDPDVLSQKNMFLNQIQSIWTRINSIHSKNEKLNTEIDKFEKELLTLK